MKRALLAFALVLAACPTARLPRVPGDPAPAYEDDAKERAYQAVLEEWTRQQAIYDHLDTRLFVAATLQSRAFVETRLQRWADFKVVPPAELMSAKQAELDRLANATEFFVGVHVNETHFDDFDRSDSMWRIALVVDGKDLQPMSIERLGRTNVEMRSVYSYMESFWVAYRVRFVKVVPASGKMTLRLASSVGRADLEFRGE